MRSIRFALAVLLLAVVTIVGAAEKVRLGDLEYTVPDGWTGTVSGGVLTIRTDQASLRTARIQILQDEAIGGSLQACYDRKAEQFREGRTIAAKTDPERQSEQGLEALAGVMVYSETQFELIMVFGFEDRGIALRAQMTEAEQIDAIQAPLLKLLDSITLSESAVSGTGTTGGDSGTPTSTTGTVSQDSGMPASRATGTPGARVSADGTIRIESPTLDLSEPVPTDATMPLGDPAEAGRRLAREYVEQPERRLAILTEVIRASGFNIRRADRSLVARALTAEPTNVWFQDSDVVAYAAMSRGFTQFNLHEIGMAFEAGKTKAGLGEFGQSNWVALMAASVTEALDSEVPSEQLYAHFIDELFFAVGGSHFSDTTAWRDVPCDPAIVLLTFHPFYATFKTKTDLLVKGLTSFAPSEAVYDVLYALNGQPSQPATGTSLPGYVEDGAVFVQNFVFDKAFESVVMAGLEKAGALSNTGKIAVDTLMSLLKAAEKLESLKAAQPLINAALSILKFITTYACLNTTFTVDPPGAPLPRTKSSREWAEKRVVRAKVEINSSKVQDVMKAIRPFVALTGFDIDQPASGPVGNARINWTILDKNPPVAFQAQSGSPIRGATTSDGGEVKIEVVGQPQRRDMTRDNPTPYIRRVPIGFTIGIKGPSMGQDVTDALITATPFILPFALGPGAGGVVPTGGDPIKAGGDAVPVLGVIMETLYRADWAYQGFMLDVKDWQFQAILLDLDIFVEGSGTNSEGQRVTVRRRLSTVSSSSSELPGTRFTSTGNSAGASTGLANIPDGGGAVNEYKPDPDMFVNLTINDSIVGKRKINVGDCMESEEVEIDDWTTYTAPIPGQFVKQQSIDEATMWLKERPESWWKAWLRIDSFPSINTEIRRPRSVTQQFMPWAAGDMAEALKDFEFTLFRGDVRSYPAQDGAAAFAIATYSGSEPGHDRSSPRSMTVLGIRCFASVEWTITIVAAEPAEQARIEALWRFGRAMGRDALADLWLVRRDYVARRANSTEEQDGVLAAGSCVPTNARILRGTPPR